MSEFSEWLNLLNNFLDMRKVSSKYFINYVFEMAINSMFKKYFSAFQFSTLRWQLFKKGQSLKRGSIETPQIAIFYNFLLCNLYRFVNCSYQSDLLFIGGKTKNAVSSCEKFMMQLLCRLPYARVWELFVINKAVKRFYADQT